MKTIQFNSEYPEVFKKLVNSGAPFRKLRRK